MHEQFYNPSFIGENILAFDALALFDYYADHASVVTENSPSRDADQGETLWEGLFTKEFWSTPKRSQAKS